MPELHLRQPIWYGDRSNPCIGIARWRVTKLKFNRISEQYVRVPQKGNFKLYIDYQKKDAEGNLRLAYPNPFVMPCVDVIKYPIMVLQDFRHTPVHLVPLSAMREVKERRKRMMPQDQFAQIREQAIQIAAEERLK
jgi:hypothetical protein